MDYDSKISIVGGDARQAAAAAMLAEEGFEVAIFANNSKDVGNATRAADLEGALRGSFAVLLPLPYSADKTTVFTPMYDKSLYLSEVVSKLEGQLLLGGLTKGLSDIYDGEIIDYFEDEELQILNAIPTAEGAIAIAMEALPITLHGSRCLVVGFGRVAKALAHDLHGLGATVTIMARKRSDFAYCELYGYNVTDFSELKSGLSGYDVVFNTVPQKLFGEEVLKMADKAIYFIDLASKPGGIDFEAAKSLGLKVNWALSLPGKVAPFTAGKIITRSILGTLRKRNTLSPCVKRGEKK